MLFHKRLSSTMPNDQLETIHTIEVCLLSQSAPEKHNQEKQAHIPLRASWISQTCVGHVL